MNPNTPPPTDDDLPDERELAAIYARLPGAEPDAALDARVRALATAGVRPRTRWPLALGSAAALVLAVGVAWQLRDARPPASEIASEPAPAIALRERADATGERRRDNTAKTAEIAPEDTTSGLVATLPAPPPPAAPPAPVRHEAPAPRVARSMAPAAKPQAAVALRSPGIVDADVSASAAAPRPDLAPDDRVGEIRRLLGSGQRELALRRLRELRERYPRYDLPQDLRDLTP